MGIPKPLASYAVAHLLAVAQLVSKLDGAIKRTIGGAGSNDLTAGVDGLAVFVDSAELADTVVVVQTETDAVDESMAAGAGSIGG